MAQFVAFENGIEVNGATINSIVDGFGNYKSLAIRYLLDQGIGEKDGNNLIKMGPEDWYPQTAWLKVFEMISKQSKTTLAGTVTHDDTQPCRKNGADSCNYIVTW